MTDRIDLGPYTAGEIPPPFAYTFTDSDGAAIDLTGYEARFVWARNDGDPTTRTAAVTGAATGEATHTWIEADLADGGSYRAEMWVGDGTNRFASPPIVYFVRDAVDVPAI